MDWVVVKRYRFDGDGDDKCYLSLFSPQDLSLRKLCENLNLPPYIEDHEMECNSCGPLLYLDDLEGNIVLCNLTTKQLKLIPPPPNLRKVSFNASGLGYDSESDDYKVIRNYCKKNEFSKLKTELYSLKSGCWKTIPSPDACIEGGGSVYVSGRYYWIASLGKSFGDPSPISQFDILSFDFTTETFDYLLRPPRSEDLDLAFNLVEYYGSLGAIGFEKEGFSPKVFELWVWEETLWEKVFDIVLSVGSKRWSENADVIAELCTETDSLNTSVLRPLVGIDQRQKHKHSQKYAL